MTRQVTIPVLEIPPCTLLGFFTVRPQAHLLGGPCPSFLPGSSPSPQAADLTCVAVASLGQSLLGSSNRGTVWPGPEAFSPQIVLYLLAILTCFVKWPAAPTAISAGDSCLPASCSLEAFHFTRS